jgi:ABC-type Na+ efflux pump permease subunit
MSYAQIGEEFLATYPQYAQIAGQYVNGIGSRQSPQQPQQYPPQQPQQYPPQQYPPQYPQQQAAPQQAVQPQQSTGLDINSAVTTAAIAAGPEYAIGYEAAKWYGKPNGIYTAVILLILFLFWTWFNIGIFCGSSISVDNGWEFSTGAGCWTSGS